jgi:REP element-mobilizing transposase RayT
METDKDHIHILTDIDPQFGVMNFVKEIDLKIREM